MLTAGAALVGVSIAHGDAGSATAEIRDAGTFRIGFRSDRLIFDYIDPALAYTFAAWSVLDPACAKLMNYPDKDAPDGLEVVPEAAAKRPRVSNGGRTYTFTLRSGLRFSNGEPLRASAFARAIARVRALREKTAGSVFIEDIVDVTARGRVLAITLRRPNPDFPARTTMPFFCAVPPDLPVDAEGVRAPLHSAGPFYVAEYVRGRHVLLLRNRFYRGTRTRHVNRIDVDLGADSFPSLVDRVERSLVDWVWAPPIFYFDPSRYRRLVGKFRLNRSRFWVEPGLSFRSYALNTSRPLFRNVRLRRAVNFAVNRPAVRRAFGGASQSRLTDQYLPPGLPGFRPASIYPLTRPNLGRARALARGHTASGRAVLYVPDLPPHVAAAQAVQRALARIGLDVEVKSFPIDVYVRVLSDPDAPWDIAFNGWAPDYIDPSNYLNALFDGASEANLSRFNSKRYNSRLRRAARLSGRVRYAEYGKLDVELARKAAPSIAIDYVNEPTLVSNRVDPRCIVLRPTLDLAAVCLKR